MVVINDVDYQISCMLRKTDDGVVLKSCPFMHSQGHGDRSCMLLLMLASDNPDKEVVRKVDDSMKAIFGDIPPEVRQALVNNPQVYNALGTDLALMDAKGDTCPAASLEFMMANKMPAEFSRWAQILHLLKLKFRIL